MYSACNFFKNELKKVHGEYIMRARPYELKKVHGEYIMRARPYEARVPRQENRSADGEVTSRFLHPTQSAPHNVHLNVVHSGTALLWGGHSK